MESIVYLPLHSSTASPASFRSISSFSPHRNRVAKFSDRVGDSALALRIAAPKNA